MRLRIIDVTPMGERLIASYLILLGDTAVLIDTGPHSTWRRVYDAVRSEGARLEWIILTHIHLDHAGASGALARMFPGVKVLVHPRGARHIVNPEKLWSASRSVLGPVADLYGKPEPVPEGSVVSAEDGYVVEVGGERFRILHTPGHASHHMSIYLERHGLMFLGDSAGIVIEYEGEVVQLPSTPPPFKPDAYLNSVERMIESMPREAAPGHYGTIVDATDYLRMHLGEVKRWIDAVKSALEEGITDIDKVAEYVANHVPTASKLYSSSNPVISKMFYYGTIWGLVEALKPSS